MIKVDSTDITDYLADEGYKVEWYDLSYDAGRQANGMMHYNVVAEKYKILLTTRHLTQTEATTFFTKIRAGRTYSIQFFDPFSGTYLTKNCYRGDRSIQMKWDRTDSGILLAPVEVHFIEL